METPFKQSSCAEDKVTEYLIEGADHVTLGLEPRFHSLPNGFEFFFVRINTALSCHD